MSPKKMTAFFGGLAIALLASAQVMADSVYTVNLYKPSGIAVTPDGQTYTANPYKGEIDKFDSSGNHLFTYGLAGTGEGNFRGCQGVSVDSLGRVFVADTGNSRIVRFIDMGQTLLWDKVIVASDQLNFPRDIYIDSSDRLFVVDTEDAVKAFDVNGEPFPLFAGGVNRFGTSGSEPGQLRNPSGVFVDSTGNIYVADTYNNRVQKFNGQGSLIAVFGQAGVGPGEFLSPTDVAANTEGRIYVADSNNHRIQEIDAQGNYISDTRSLNEVPGPRQNATAVAIDSRDQLVTTVVDQITTNKSNADHTPPTVVVTGLEHGGVYGYPVAPVITVQDLNPGVSAFTLDGMPFDSGTLVSTEGEHVLSIFAEDGVGNSVRVDIRFILDFTPPVVRFVGAVDGHAYDRDVTVTFEVYDNLDPEPLWESDYDSGAMFTSSSPYTIEVTTWDWAGNTSTYQLCFEICKLSDLVSAVAGTDTKNKGITNSLMAKLENALRLMDNGNIVSAMNLLRAFINELEAQRCKAVSCELADTWIQFAENLILLMNREMNEMPVDFIVRADSSMLSSPGELVDVLAAMGTRRMIVELYMPTGAGSGIILGDDDGVTSLPGGAERDLAHPFDLSELIEHAKTADVEVIGMIHALRTVGGEAISAYDSYHAEHLLNVLDYFVGHYPDMSGILVDDLTMTAQFHEDASTEAVAAMAASFREVTADAGMDLLITVQPAWDDESYMMVKELSSQSYEKLGAIADELMIQLPLNVDMNRDGHLDFTALSAAEITTFVAASIPAGTESAVLTAIIPTYGATLPLMPPQPLPTTPWADEPEYLECSPEGLGDVVETLWSTEVGRMVVDHFDGTSNEELDAIVAPGL